MCDFPDHISTVSNIEPPESKDTPKPLVETDSPPSPTKPAPLWAILQEAAPHFYHRFPGFRMSTPLYQKIDDTYRIRIVAIWYQNEIPRHCELVYLLKKTGSAARPLTASFDPFASTPQPHQPNGINWTGLYYVEFESALYILQKLLEDNFCREAKEPEHSLFSLV